MLIDPFSVIANVIPICSYAWMAYNRAKVIGIDAGMASTRGKSNDVKHTLGSSNNNMISTCPDSSDGRALDM